MFRYCYYVSNVGNKRSNNEDSIQINNLFFNKELNVKGKKRLKNKSLISICDGMGGTLFGEVASLIAVKELSRISSHNLEVEDMLSSIKTINNLVCDEMNNRKTKMGSTLVSAVINKDYIDIYNVGDSRAYVFSDKLIQVSKDHNYKDGSLTQHLGIPSDDILIEPFVIDKIKMLKNNYLLMCSDGLYNMVSEEEITEILKMKIKEQKKCDLLLDTALKNGGKDNISFFLVKF